MTTATASSTPAFMKTVKISRAVLSEGAPTFEMLVERGLSGEFVGGPEGLPRPGLYDRVLEQVERPLITMTLAATRGNQVRAAEILGLNRNTLRKKITDLGIKVRG